MSSYLIVADVNHIQDYVFGANRLRAIRGASALLEQAAEAMHQVVQGASGGCIRWHGGQLVAILEEGKLEGGNPDLLCARLEQLIRERTGGAASLASAWVPYTGEFKAAVGQAFRIVRRHKDGLSDPGPSLPMLSSSPYERRCSLCQRYPAGPDATHPRAFWRPAGAPPGEVWYLCAACWERMQAVEGSGFDRALVRAMGLAYGEVRLPYEIQDLWPSGREGRFMAVVMADGNGIGQLLEVIDDKDLYRRFSRAIYDCGIDAMAAAALDARIARDGFENPDGAGFLLPMMPIIMGGDDFSVLLRADHALTFARSLCLRFAECSQRYDAIGQVIRLFQQANPAVANRLLSPTAGPPRLTLSAGVAVAKPSFPIGSYRRLAGELRSNAKSALYQAAPPVPTDGMIDFALVTSASAASLPKLRQQYELFDGTILTARPYSLGEFRLLETLGRSLCKIARSKRKYLYTELWRGRASATEAYRLVLSQEIGIDRLIRDALKDLGCSEPDSHPFDTRNKTPLVDALEIADLLGQEDLE